MERIIISLGGSLIVPEKVDIEFLKQFRKVILKRPEKFMVICGGGKICREYQAASQKITETKKVDLDWIGIKSTRLNAELVRAIFANEAYQEVITNPTKKFATKKKIIVGAGYMPGCSTDTDAVLLAKNVGADTIINLSNVEYVYDKDPKKFADAKPLSRMTWKQFTKIFGRKWVPGLNAPFDPIAATEASRLKLKVVIMKGSELKNLENYLEGKGCKGTVIL